jgi:hypothetical protein
MLGEVKDSEREALQRALRWLYSPLSDFLTLEEIPASEEAGYSDSRFWAKATL